MPRDTSMEVFLPSGVMVPTSESLFNLKNETKCTQKYLLQFAGCYCNRNGSCKKQLDINVDPTRPTKASVDLVLPSALGYTAYNMASPYQILGEFGGSFGHRVHSKPVQWV
jgi:hypothetical protein